MFMCIGSSIIGVCSYLVQYQTILSHSVWKSLSVVWIIYHKTKHNGEKKTRNSTKHGLSHCEKEMCARNFICSSILSLRHVFMFLHWFFSFILHWLSHTKTLFFMVVFFFFCQSLPLSFHPFLLSLFTHSLLTYYAKSRCSKVHPVFAF